MATTDSIADFFTRIRNAINVKAEQVTIPYSRIKMELAQVLKNEGFVGQVEEDKKNSIKRLIHIQLKYRPDGTSLIEAIDRVSTPGRRVYIEKAKIPKIKNGFGICILTTPKGILTGREARLNNLGGELMGVVY